MRRYALAGAKAVVTASLLAVVFRNVDPAPVVARLAGMTWIWAAAAAAAMASQLALTALRWSMVCRLLHIALPRMQALRLMLIGGFFGQTLPSGLGGDAVRAWLLARAGPGMRSAISAVLCDRLFAMAVLLALVCATAPLYLYRIASPEARAGLPVALAVLAAGMGLSVALGPSLLSRLGRFALGEATHLTLLELRRVLFGSSVSLWLFALALLVHAALVFSCFALARALGVSIAVLDCVAIVPLIMLASAIPISIAGWGVREGAMVAGLGLLDVPAEVALAISIAFGLLQLALYLPGGLLWAFTRDFIHQIPSETAGAPR